jgi:hypothetical protein
MTLDNPNTTLDLTHLEIRIKWTEDAWAAQLCYGENVLLEGRQLGVEQEVGFVQSFLWFCEEASFLAYEFKAREGGWRVRKGEAIDEEPLNEKSVMGDGRAKVSGRSKAGSRGRALKLKIRIRNTARGPAGVWRVE